MVVEHPSTNEVPHPSKNFEDFILPVHCLLGTYHWARLDDTHVFVTGHYEVSHHAAIHSHPKVSALPSLGSSRQCKHHTSIKAHHWNALASRLALPDDATSSDVADAAESMFGVLFGADK